MAVTLNQTSFRFRTDSGAVEAAPTWGAAENANYNPGTSNFRLRFAIQNSGSTQSALQKWNLFCAKNGGAYTQVTDVTTFGVKGANASSDASNVVLTTQRLTDTAGTLVTGRYSEAGGNDMTTQRVGATSNTEFEYGLVLDPPNLANGDTLDFRVYGGTTAFTGTYSQTPRITVSGLGTTYSVDVAESATASDGPDATATTAADAFIARTSGLNATHENAARALIAHLIANDIWGEIDFLHVYATQGSATAKLLNFKSTSFTATVVGAPTFSEDFGYTGSGDATLTNYINTNYNPSTAGGRQSQNWAHCLIWSNTSAAVADSHAIAAGTGAGRWIIEPRWSGDETYVRLNEGATPSNGVANTDGSGLFVVTRTGPNAADEKAYHNATDIGLTGAASASPINATVTVLGNAAAGTPAGWAGQAAAAGAGGGLSASQVAAYYDGLASYFAAILAPSAAAESATAADVPSATLVTARAITESATAADAPVGNVVYPASVAESAAATDAPNRSVTTAAAIAETAGASDAVSSGLIQSATVAESVAASDAAGAIGAYSVARSETAAATDSPAATYVTPAAMAESAAASDGPSSVAGAISVAVAETTGATDGQGATVAAAGAVSEAVAAAEAGSAVLSAVGAVAEVAGAAESPANIALMGVAVAETAGAAESWTGFRGPLVNLDESAAATDSPDATAQTVATRTEAAAVADAPTAAAIINAAVAESAAATTTVGGGKLAAAALAESIAATTTQGGALVVSSEVTEAAGADEDLSVIALFVAAIAELSATDDRPASESDLDIVESVAAEDAPSVALLPFGLTVRGLPISGRSAIRDTISGDMPGHHIEGSR